MLIALGIIGIIAALTLPGLTAKYKKHEVETKLKKFYSVINEAVKLSEIDNGNKNGWDYFTLQSADFWKKYLEKYMKVVKVDIPEEQTIGGVVFVYLADGSLVRISSYGRDYFLFINSSKRGKDVVYGKDVFSFLFYPVSSDGTCWPSMGHTCNKGIEPYTYNWDGTKEHLFNQCNKDTPDYCAKIIQDNGWKIPDDYPVKF